MSWNWSVIFDNLPKLLEGTLLTLELVLLSLLVGAMLSIPLALMRVSGNPLIRSIPLAYTFFFRGTPPAGPTIPLLLWAGAVRRCSGKHVLALSQGGVLVCPDRIHPQYHGLHH